MNTINDYTLSVNNKEIWEFFNENPSIDFESSLLVLIDIFDLTLKNTENTINTKINSRILSSVTEQFNQLRELKNDISLIKSDVLSSLVFKFSELKKDYTEEVKTIVQVNSNNSFEKISSLIDKSNSTLIDKTKILLTDIVPKTNDSYYRQMQENIQQFEKNIINETSKLFNNSNNENSLNDFINNFEAKTTSMLQSAQTPIYNFITASEDRINKNLIKINEQSVGSSLVQEKLFSGMDDFLNKNKYINSSIKGKTGENQLEEILNNMFPSCFIKNTSGSTASGDFILQQRENNKPNILFENKQYSANVNNEEVNKFIRDIRSQGCHGIFISQTSGIVCKKQFEIQIVDSLVAVYILNCNYDADKIKIAVDIIDKIASCLSTIINNDNNAENTTISSEILQLINEEYGKFSNQKIILIENMKNLTKDLLKKVVDQVEELKFPSLDTFLSNKLGAINIQSDDTLLCDHCNKFTAANKRAMGAHKKGCLKKIIANEPPTQLTNVLIRNI